MLYLGNFKFKQYNGRHIFLGTKHMPYIYFHGLLVQSIRCSLHARKSINLSNRFEKTIQIGFACRSSGRA